MNVDTPTLLVGVDRGCAVGSLALDAERSLSVGEWSVLGLLCEGPAHGWALAETLAPEGEVGAVWSLSRPLVYRALETLEQLGLVERVGLALSTRGPSRTVSRPTKQGRAAFGRWLREPVEHIRDLRPTLLLKLVFLYRAKRDARKLLDGQRSLIEGLLSGLDQQLADVSAETGILVRYRIEVARAALRFVDAEQRATELVGSP